MVRIKNVDFCFNFIRIMRINKRKVNGDKTKY